MSEIYNREYYQHYDVGIDKVDYQDSIYTRKFLTDIAKRIAEDIHPSTVLDAGCAMGHLVAALRDLGIEAYGIDISEYAISRIREDIKPFCVVGSLTEPLPQALPQRYDLVVTIEVLEHLYAEDGRKAIQNLCKLSDKIIFSSTPDDFTERTHVNVQQREYWARIFAAEGFIDDLNYRPTYLTPYALCFQRSSDWLRQLEDYERNIRLTEAQQRMDIRNWTKAIEDKERHIQNQNFMLQDAERQRAELEAKHAEELQVTERQRAELEAKHTEDLHALEQQSKEQEDLLEREIKQIEEKLRNTQVQYEESRREKEHQYEAVLQEKTKHTADVEGQLAHYKEHYFAAINQREDLKRQVAALQVAYGAISNATFWKMTRPLRAAIDLIRRILKSNYYTDLFCKGLKCWKENGTRYTWKKVQDKLRHRQDFMRAARPAFTQAELEQQRKDVFPKKVRFSVLVPLYNTPENFLHEMIRSVLDQTYANWELCMADGSDEEHRYVEKICHQYARKDDRIKYKKLKQNLGISENTNACIDMATGDYVALLDHDDLLHPAALHEVMKAICEQGADLIYTDENTFHNKPEDAYCPHFKPDYAPDTLRSYNYICHFTVFQKELLKQTGRFRQAFDGSQDYDMILRLTECAVCIVHIPLILYYWRAHRDSTAEDLGSKRYALTAARLALKEHLDRIGLKGKVQDSDIPSTYRIVYELTDLPLISIIIPNMDHVSTLKVCIDSILEKTTYPNYEIVIVENNSLCTETFQYYDELRADPHIQVKIWTGKFNYSAINNWGVQYANGEYFLLLNNDVEIISADWLQEMLMFCQREEIGAVGTMLYYPDDTVQHGGVILGVGGIAGHAHKHFPRNSYGYMSRLTIVQDLSAVTGACMMVRRDVWNEVKGLDEGFEVAFNDVDLCMRIRQAGYLIVWTPYAELYHYESESRGYEDTPEKQERFESEVHRFQGRWAKELAAGDPYYNPNLTLDREDFSLK